MDDDEKSLSTHPRWQPLTTREIKGAKEVIVDDRFYISDKIEAKQNVVARALTELAENIRSGNNLDQYYRRSNLGDLLLVKYKVMHLHLWSCGGDVLVYLRHYPNHVHLLCVDTHCHLETLPPGKNLDRRGMQRIESALKRGIGLIEARAKLLSHRLFGAHR